MEAMYRKVNARENIVGWYSTGPRIRPADLEINDLFKKYVPNPVLVIIDVQPKEEYEIPTKSYVALEEVREDSTEAPKIQFQHITSEIGALEAEEVGVEHLLRDVKDTSVSTLATQLHAKMLSLKSLISHIGELHHYLELVASGKLPLNHQILAQVQDIFNMAPNLKLENLQKNFQVKINDMMLVIYLSSMIRSIIALHSLINNKADLKELEKNEDAELQKKEDKKNEKAAEKVDKDNKAGEKPSEKK
eukprot:TRINITY_DN765_c0_g1_i2.p1 TRINITY_DN765_c0_g1~~TRINITY_DN765_c0_g1_i2.p1  ORF type:complete len:248 (+),score=85.63 TRINITY_DN765_c0_g1_i2:361-1104(+)